MKTKRFVALLVAARVCYVASGAAAITIPTVPIGNPGNPADARYVDIFHPYSVGSVGYSFRMGTTEITNAQYTVFLNAVAASDPYELYNGSMSSFLWGGIVRSGLPGSYTYDVKAPALGGAYTYDNKPVIYVSAGDAMRFANWLHNGQPTGAEDASTTEDGAYTLNGAVTSSALLAVQRNPGARWWLPNEDEWYKAAYHKNDGATGNYWDFPTASNSMPNNNQPSNDTGSSANYYYVSNGYTNGTIDYPLTDVGAYTQSRSAYGTFDQGGSVWEWNETVYSDFYRYIRGGSWFDDWYYMGAKYWERGNPANSFEKDIGFRVATVPEPASVMLGLAGAILLALSKKQPMRRCC